SGYNVGDQYAYAAHLVGNYDRWNLQLQVAHYDYKVGNDYDRMVVGAYAYYDTIARRATSYTGNLAYSLPVQWGPVSNLTFYNDYFYITDKPNNLSRSEEHTSELQSRFDLVCRLLLEKKNNNIYCI